VTIQNSAIAQVNIYHTCKCYQAEHSSTNNNLATVPVPTINKTKSATSQF